MSSPPPPNHYVDPDFPGDSWFLSLAPPFTYALPPNRLVVALWIPAPDTESFAYVMLADGNQVHLSEDVELCAYRDSAPEGR